MFNIDLYTGVMCSGKTKALIEKAERLRIMGYDYLIFYPLSCSNGEADSIYSRADLREKAEGVNNIKDLFTFVHLSNNMKNIKHFIVDEVQFLDKENEENLTIFKRLLQYCEANKINLYIAGIETDFANNPFKFTQMAMSYATNVYKLKAICEICKKENASKNFRMRNGSPCNVNEPVLIEKNDTSVEYMPICPQCYHEKYARIEG